MILGYEINKKYDTINVFLCYIVMLCILIFIFGAVYQLFYSTKVKDDFNSIDNTNTNISNIDGIAIIVIDWWESHPCPTLNEKLKSMSSDQNYFLSKFREKGASILWAVAGADDYKEYSELRRNILSVINNTNITAPFNKISFPSGMPYEYKCDVNTSVPANLRVSSHLGIDSSDYMSSNIDEIWAWAMIKNITHFYYTGVSLGQCITWTRLHSSEYLKEGFNVALIKELTTNGFKVEEYDPLLWDYFNNRYPVISINDSINHPPRFLWNKWENARNSGNG